MQQLASRLESITRGVGIAAAWLTLAMVLIMNSLSIAFRMYLRGKKKW